MNAVNLRLAALLLCAACHHPGSRPPEQTPGNVAASCTPLSPVRSLLTTPFAEHARGEAARIEALFSRARELIGSDVLTGEQLLMVMVKEDPRFPQEAVYILQTPPRPQPREYRVVHARAKEQIAFQKEPIEADFSEVAIDSEVVHALQGSWGVMTRRAKWPSREDSVARLRVGAQYTFDYTGDNVYGQGDAVSPEPSTCAGALVEIGELLIRFADKTDAKERREIRAALLRRSHALAERLGAP